MPQDVGVEGIVLVEGENSFTIITPNNTIKRINKKGHAFQIQNIDSIESKFILSCRKDYTVWRLFKFTV